ncbi:MAG: hypothetical protein ACREFH_05085 [Stellaceae bacterium]
MKLIQCIGRHDLRRGPLTNQTDGGDGVSNPSEKSRRARAATLSGEAEDFDRRAANAFFHSLQRTHYSDSVPIKPVDQMQLVPLTVFEKRKHGPTPRIAQALLAGAVSRRILLAPGCKISRIFVAGHIEVAIENGAGRAILQSGLATLLPNARSPEDEVFVLSEKGYRYILQEFGADRLLDLGVIEPPS